MNLIETCALVTGGASGIGEATVRTIVSKGGSKDLSRRIEVFYKSN